MVGGIPEVCDREEALSCRTSRGCLQLLFLRHAFNPVSCYVLFAVRCMYARVQAELRNIPGVAEHVPSSVRSSCTELEFEADVKLIFRPSALGRLDSTACAVESSTLNAQLTVLSAVSKLRCRTCLSRFFWASSFFLLASFLPSFWASCTLPV